jgi:hypothetical protein
MEISLNPTTTTPTTTTTQALNITVSNIQVINNQIVITGTNLMNVTDFQIKNNGATTNLQIEAQTNTSIVANTLANVSYAAEAILDFVFSNASGAATYTVNLSLGTSPTIVNPVIANIAPAADFTLTQNSVIPFKSISSGAMANTLYLEAGKVGIGTTAPANALHVYSSTAAPALFSGYSVFGGAASYQGSILIGAVSGNQGIIDYNSSGSTTYTIKNTYGTGTINFDVGASHSMSVVGGNVGIGTTSPGAKLEVAGDISLSSGAARTIQIPTPASGNGNSLTIRAASGATPSNSGGALNLYAGNGYWGSSGALLTMEASAFNGGNVNLSAGTADSNGLAGTATITGGNGINYAGGNVYLIGGTGNGVGNVILANNGAVSRGNVGIGTITPGAKLQVGDLGDGSVALANAWNLLSDERLKRDFEIIPDSLEKILSLNGYYYYWNRGTDTSKKMGVKAQEVEKVFPEVVSHGADGFLSVSYNHLVAGVIEAVKEFYHKWLNDSKGIHKELAQIKIQDIAKDRAIALVNAKIAKLEAENAQLKKENAAFKVRMDKIEQKLLKK